MSHCTALGRRLCPLLISLLMLVSPSLTPPAGAQCVVPGGSLGWQPNTNVVYSLAGVPGDYLPYVQAAFNEANRVQNKINFTSQGTPVIAVALTSTSNGRAESTVTRLPDDGYWTNEEIKKRSRSRIA